MSTKKDKKHKVVIKIKYGSDDDDENVNSISVSDKSLNNPTIKDCQADKKERVLIKNTIDRYR